MLLQHKGYNTFDIVVEGETVGVVAPATLSTWTARYYENGVLIEVRCRPTKEEAAGMLVRLACRASE